MIYRGINKNKVALLITITFVAILHHQVIYAVWGGENNSYLFALIGASLIPMALRVVTAKKMNVLQVWIFVTLAISTAILLNVSMDENLSAAYLMLMLDLVVILLSAFVCLFMGNLRVDANKP